MALITTATESASLIARLDTNLVDLLPAAAYICEAPSGLIVHFNHRATELWGRVPALDERAEYFCGCHQLYHTDGTLLAPADSPMAQVLTQGVSIRDQVAVIERPDGSRRTVLININPLVNDEGAVIGAINVFTDITEYQPATQVQSETDAGFSRLLENLPAAVFTCDREGLLTYFNQAAAALWGSQPALKSAAHRYCGPDKIFTHDGLPLSHEEYWRSSTRDKATAFRAREILVEGPDHNQTPILSYTSPLSDAKGKLSGTIHVWVDISERKYLEEKSRLLLEALHGEWEQLIEVFERSPAFMAVFRGPEFIIERANERFHHLVGNRDIIGRPMREAIPEAEGQKHLHLLEEVYRTNTAIHAADERILFDTNSTGELEERYLEFVYGPLRTIDGSISGILVHGIDLTERKGVEQRLVHVTMESERARRLYETVLSNIPDMVYVFDLKGRFSYANQALLRMWGKTAEEALGKNFLELGYPAWHAAKHDREIRTVVKTKQPLRDEVPFIDDEGLNIYDYIFAPVLGDGGEVEAIVGAMRDVTQRKQLEQELQTRVEESAAAERKKDEFIALLAHELRNPLAPVRNGLQVLSLAGNNPEKIDRVHKMMDRQLTHMVRLIDDLLDVSRMNRNKLHLQKTQVLIEEVINNAVETVRPAIEAAHHELFISLPDEPLYLNADLTRLAQVFSNLLSNSVKYTPPGGQLWLDVERQNNRVKVSVRDTGIGIPPAALNRVFDMFSQVPRSVEDHSGGLGIGLALVKVLVEMHGGEVTAASDWPSKGSVFTVHLPIIQVVPDSPERATKPPLPTPERAARHILVVDDNQDSSHSMAMIFELLGHEVRVAHDGLQAIATVEEFQPDIVLMDIGMPNLNGYDATRQIRARPGGADITIIAITGWGQENDRARSKAAGCDGHLVKPVSLQDIEKLLADLHH
jgi:PAS domain S-box-containing protein